MADFFVRGLRGLEWWNLLYNFRAKKQSVRAPFDLHDHRDWAPCDVFPTDVPCPPTNAEASRERINIRMSCSNPRVTRIPEACLIRAGAVPVRAHRPRESIWATFACISRTSTPPVSKLRRVSSDYSSPSSPTTFSCASTAGLARQQRAPLRTTLVVQTAFCTTSVLARQN